MQNHLYSPTDDNIYTDMSLHTGLKDIFKVNLQNWLSPNFLSRSDTLSVTQNSIKQKRKPTSY